MHIAGEYLKWLFDPRRGRNFYHSSKTHFLFPENEYDNISVRNSKNFVICSYKILNESKKRIFVSLEPDAIFSSHRNWPACTYLLVLHYLSSYVPTYLCTCTYIVVDAISYFSIPSDEQ